MTDKFDGLYIIRSAVESDKNFVLQSFLLGIYYGDSWFSKIPKRVFMDNYKQVAEALFYRAYVKIACLPEDPDTILGYAIMSRDETVLHFVYVKKSKGEASWRNHGIATRLVSTWPSQVTHLTALGEELLKKYKDKPTPMFNPFNLGIP